MKVHYNAGKGNGSESKSAGRKSAVALVFASAALLLSGTSVAVNWDRVKATCGKAHSALVGTQAPNPEAKEEAPAKSMSAPISPPEAKGGGALEQTNEEWIEEHFGKKQAPEGQKPPTIKIIKQPAAEAGPLRIEPWQLPDYHGKKAKKKPNAGGSGSEGYGSSSGEGGFVPPPTAVAGSTGKSGSASTPKKAPATSAEELPEGFTPPPTAVAGE